MTYSIDDMHGSELVAGIADEENALTLARKLAAQRREIVCVYSVSRDRAEEQFWRVCPDGSAVLS